MGKMFVLLRRLMNNPGKWAVVSPAPSVEAFQGPMVSPMTMARIIHGPLVVAARETSSRGAAHFFRGSPRDWLGFLRPAAGGSLSVAGVSRYTYSNRGHQTEGNGVFGEDRGPRQPSLTFV